MSTEAGGPVEAKAAFERRQRRVGLAATGVALGMLGLAFASVPLYRMFCQATGYGGTTQRAERASDVILDRKVTVRFDANVAPGLKWRFEPVQQALDVRIGENTLAFFKATNLSDKPSTGTAVFNVLPEQVGIHFNKVQCFCFTEQVLEPGQSIEMPVSFFVDTAFASDKDTKDFTDLTLSYTFYPATRAEAGAAQIRAGKGS